jgi:hypothetical protein
MKIIGGYTSNIKEMSDISHDSYIGYCWDNNIALERHEITGLDRPPAWYKIQLILDEFDKGEEWVMWVDADTLLVNNNFDITQLLDKTSEIIISKDINALNTGVMLWKNTPRTRSILNSIWESTEFMHHPWWENAAFINLYNENLLGMQDVVKIVPQNILNAYDYNLYGVSCESGQLNDESFIFHLPGLPHDLRLVVMKKFVEKLNSQEA